MLNTEMKKALPPGKIAGIDFGTARIGIAISDEHRRVALPWKTIAAKPSLEAVAEDLIKELEEKKCPLLVLGLPLLLSGKESPLSLKVRQLSTILSSKMLLPPILWDERLTTAQVDRTMKEADFSRKKRSKYVDVMAATLILQSYLDSLSFGCI